MTPNLQQWTVAEYIQRTYSDVENWPFESAAELQDELVTRGLGINPGEYLVVVGLDGNNALCGKACGLNDLAAFPQKSLIISYHELERAFHEQHADWVEL